MHRDTPQKHSTFNYDKCYQCNQRTAYHSHRVELYGSGAYLCTGLSPRDAVQSAVLAVVEMSVIRLSVRLSQSVIIFQNGEMYCIATLSRSWAITPPSS